MASKKTLTDIDFQNVTRCINHPDPVNGGDVANRTFVLAQLAAVGGAPNNLLINGDFEWNQRAYAGTILSVEDFSYDRWYAVTGSQVTKSGDVVTFVSNSEMGQVVQPSLWGYQSFASLQVTVSVEDPSQDMTAAFGSQSGTITAGSGRQSVTLTLGGGDTGDLLFSLKRAAAGDVTFKRVQLEIGATANEWRARPSIFEKQLANYYYERLTFNSAFLSVIGGRSSIVGTGVLTYDLKRVAPTITASSPVTTFDVVGLANEDIASITGESIGTLSTGIRATLTGTSPTNMTVGSAYQLRTTANGFIELDAELVN